MLVFDGTRGDHTAWMIDTSRSRSSQRLRFFHVSVGVAVTMVTVTIIVVTPTDTNTCALRTVSGGGGGDQAWRRGETAWACRAALGLEKFARADHHDIKKKEVRKRRCRSTRGHGHILLSSTGLRRHQPQMQEHIDLLLAHDAIDYTRVTKKLSVKPQ